MKLFIFIFCFFTLACNATMNSSSDDSSTDDESEDSSPSDPNSDESSGVYPRFSVGDGKILENGEEINLFGVNWFGFETSDHVVHGLWERNSEDMMLQMKELRFNAVRLPFCPDTLRGSSTSSIDEDLNPDLEELNSLEAFDFIISQLEDHEIYFLLDHHRTDCENISELWYTSTYSEQDWIDDLSFVATRYQDFPHFLGIDLKTEPHGAATWGTGDTTTDWDLAAARAAQVLLALNDQILIFVEGIGESVTCDDPDYGYWWGGNLVPEACFPLDIDRNQLVFSPHVYGPDVYVQDYFNEADFPNNLSPIWEAHFGYLIDDEHMVVPGEFGGKYGEGDSRDVDWQNTFIDYLIEKQVCSFFYWSWNANSGDTGGILDDDWTNIEEEKYENLKRLMDYCSLSL